MVAPLFGGLSVTTAAARLPGRLRQEVEVAGFSALVAARLVEPAEASDGLPAQS
jgi:hypothetical protein